jgi:hypothetical protein
MLKIKAKSEAEKKKPGRKPSGLRDLKPEAARLSVLKAAAKLVREAEVLRKAAGKLPGAKDGVPSLERALKNDLFFASTPVAEDGHITIQPVLKSKAYEDQLRRAAVPARLHYTAKAFTADVEGAVIGKLTASYGEGLGGGSAAEPERLMIAVDRLTKAQHLLTRNERFALWASLVLNLPLVDIGHALYGGRGLDQVRLTERAALILECALERLEVHYQARA